KGAARETLRAKDDRTEAGVGRARSFKRSAIEAQATREWAVRDRQQSAKQTRARRNGAPRGQAARREVNGAALFHHSGCSARHCGRRLAVAREARLGTSARRHPPRARRILVSFSDRHLPDRFAAAVGPDFALPQIKSAL